VAALGASALTGAVAFGLEWRQSRQRERATTAARRQAAYGKLLSVSGLIGHTAGTLHLTVELRSGLKEGLDVALRHRKPVDPIELMELMRRDLEPLYEAWSEVWLVGTPEAIQIANAVVERSGRVVAAGTSQNEARNRLLRYLVGERWSQDEIDAFQAEIEGLASARKRLAEVARGEIGVDATELFYDADLQAKALQSGSPPPVPTRSS
jgi:hypothetical protein